MRSSFAEQYIARSMASYEELLDQKPELDELCEHVRIGTKWYALGVMLRLDEKRLNAIRDEFKNTDDRIINMFQLWRNESAHPTRGQILQNLKKSMVNQTSIADMYSIHIRGLSGEVVQGHDHEDKGSNCGVISQLNEEINKQDNATFTIIALKLKEKYRALFHTTQIAIRSISDVAVLRTFVKQFFQGHHQQSLQNCTTIDAIFDFLAENDFTSYLNYYILQRIIVDISEDGVLQKRMEEYELEYLKFIEEPNFQQLIEVLNNSDLKPSAVIGLPLMVIYLADSWKESSMKELKKYLPFIAEKKTQIFDLKLKCVLIHCGIIPIYLDEVTSYVEKNFNHLAANGIKISFKIVTLPTEEILLPETATKTSNNSIQVCTSSPKDIATINDVNHLPMVTFQSEIITHMEEKALASESASFFLMAKTLQEKYFNLLDSVQRKLKHNGNISAMKQVVKSFLLFRHHFHHHHSSVQQYLDHINRTASSDELFQFLAEKNFIGYLNFALIEEIVKACIPDDENLLGKVKEYEEDYSKFVAQPNFEELVKLFQQYPKLAPSSVVGLPTIVIHLADSWTKHPMKALKDYLPFVEECKLQLHSIGLKCVIITFKIFPQYLNALASYISNHSYKQHLESTGITFIELPFEIHTAILFANPTSIHDDETKCNSLNMEQADSTDQESDIHDVEKSQFDDKREFEGGTVECSFVDSLTIQSF